MTELKIIVGNLTSISPYLRHSVSHLAKMVHGPTAGSREKNGDDTPSRWLISTKFADTVELKASATRSRFA